ncbi:transcription factor bHLH128-like isoform X2 [Tripterygium wilfordii]|uniref:transcription factor bHLH128-like isoform X2 n=1 Tax=Tripterygium wilfordii TaxID=458696 RepID=UPI0018F8357B|nr:transcription factor bHLH128-like isoform X2 [Tripterygium wilfordii]
MYQSSSSSSQQQSSATRKAVPTGLTRFCSAPGSLLTQAVDSVIAADPLILGNRNYYYSSSSADSSSESTCKISSSNDPNPPKSGGLQRSYGLNEIAHSAGSLVRQRSSPAGFLSQVAGETGYSVARGSGSYNPQGGYGESRLKSQLSFTGPDSLSNISEGSEDVYNSISSDNGHQNTRHSYATNNTTSFGVDSWDNTNSIAFSTLAGKRAKNIDGDYFTCFNVLDSQFSLPQTTLEMAAVEKLLNIPEDSVPCKVRAKRGCATHPRSIAERERRIRISGKLKKLQDLVPNMDKQTSYADMLDLAVQHIKGLQNQAQKLQHDLEGCTCGCKQSI